MDTPSPQNDIETLPPLGGGSLCPQAGGPPGEEPQCCKCGGPLGVTAYAEPGHHISRRRRAQRPFDFSRHGRRHVALRLAYLGWDYQGFASQENTSNTVEAKLFEALTKTRLVESRQTANYHRSGRTDKGVSAFGQVISLDLRSQTLSPDGTELVPGAREGAEGELPYTRLLNRVLPGDIRALAWAPVPSDFSARFSCLHRTYHYLFPLAGLRLDAMQEAGRRLEGTHDFRNLCRPDVAGGVLEYQRTVMRVRVLGAGPGLGCLEVRARAFLYHQVRCMAAVLLLVGRGLEEPDVIDQLLDVHSHPRKPQYSMAVDYPLILYDCAYENVKWIFDPEVHAFNVRHLQALWASHTIKTRILHTMLSGLGQPPIPPEPEPEAEEEEESTLTTWARTQPPVTNLSDVLLDGVKPRIYKRLMERPTCEELESRIRHYAKKGRIQLPERMREAEDCQELVKQQGSAECQELKGKQDSVKHQDLKEKQQDSVEIPEVEG
ncbi:tRNA pseudouridine(38/39) synthase [Hypanus sabinus]|uniref:tRNA pseudouridine(38/39) synthase n=1 Tax=Hypanus sabinus TaxID=79690 RepID=UPI0028C4E1FB|nr:tRNA pseudouridine(38/39) synthase [Hypanus sabinus]